MQPSDITDALKRNGFVFTDIETPGGKVRVTARGPKSPADPGSDGERDTVVKAQHEGEILERSSHHNRATAARRYVELVEKFGWCPTPVGIAPADLETARIGGTVTPHTRRLRPSGPGMAVR